jgi:hypothetical protein
LFGSPSSFLLGAKSKGWGMNQQILIAIDAQTRGYEATYVGILIIKVWGDENTSPQLSYDQKYLGCLSILTLHFTNLRFNAGIMVIQPEEITS